MSSSSSSATGGTSLPATLPGRAGTPARTVGEAVIRVEDNGIGLDTEHLASVFEMFRQVDGVQPAYRRAGNRAIAGQATG